MTGKTSVIRFDNDLNIRKYETSKPDSLRLQPSQGEGVLIAAAVVRTVIEALKAQPESDSEYTVIIDAPFSKLSELATRDVSESLPEVAAQIIFTVLDKDCWGTKIAADDDLVYWDFLCSEAGDEKAADGMYRMYTHYRVQCLVLAGTYGAKHTVFERLETMTYLTLATFCQRLVNPSDEEVKKSLQLEKLMDLPNLLKDLYTDRGDGVSAAMP